MKTLLAPALALILVSPGIAKDKKKPEEDPVVWGMLSRNEGCVIFKESRKTSSRFYGVAITTKTYAVLDVIETKNYSLTPMHWMEDQDGMNQLNRLAVDNRVKMIKIQEGYSPALLEKARAMCTDTLISPDDPGGRDRDSR